MQPVERTGKIRISTYNTEWFDALIHHNGGLRLDDGWSSRWNVTRKQQGAALARVFQALDADGIMLIEAPDNGAGHPTVSSLEAFAKYAGLRARKAVIGFASHTQQEIAFLFDPDVLTPEHDPLTLGGPQFDTSLRVTIEDVEEEVVWSKPPLELKVQSPAGPLRLIGVHAKSKAAHGAQTYAEKMDIAIENRRKQLAQCIWLRRRVEGHLARGESLLVMGDFNDGPGLDAYETLFGRSGVEVVLGEGDSPALYDPAAALALTSLQSATPTTSRFWINHEKRWLQALLDYIMVSPDLRARKPEWRIWHPLDDPDCFDTPDLREALLTASDHFPVSIDIPQL